MDSSSLTRWTGLYQYKEYILPCPKSRQCNPDQTPRSVASDLSLHCLPMSLSWDARHKWIKFYLNRVQCSWDKHVTICDWRYNYSDLLFTFTGSKFFPFESKPAPFQKGHKNMSVLPPPHPSKGECVWASTRENVPSDICAYSITKTRLFKYINTPIQVNRKFHAQKLKIFR